MKTVRQKTGEKRIRGEMENRERERAFIVRGDCEVIRPFVAKVIEQFFSFFFFFSSCFPVGLLPVQRVSLSRVQSPYSVSDYRVLAVVTSIVTRVQYVNSWHACASTDHSPICIKASAYTEKRCRVRVRSTHISGKHTIFCSFSSIKNIASTKILWIR